MSDKKGRGRPRKSIINDDNNIIESNDNKSSFENNSDNDIPHENNDLNNQNFEDNDINHNDSHNDSNHDDNNHNDNNHNENLDNDNNSTKTTFKKPKSNKTNSSFINSGNELDDDIDNELAEFEKQEGLNDIPEDTFRPLDGAVKKRGYTGGNMGLDDNDAGNSTESGDNVIYKQEKGSEKVIDEPKYTGVGHSKKPEVDATLINPTNSEGEVLDSHDGNNYYNQNQNQ